MRSLTAVLLALVFALGTMSAHACSRHEQTASKPSQVASAEEGAPASAKIEVPEKKSPQS